MLLLVTGKVTDAESKAVADLIVTGKGTRRYTTTNSSGNFSFNTTDVETLVFSSVGFLTQEVPLKGRTFVSIVRGEGTIDEAVVTI